MLKEPTLVFLSQTIEVGRGAMEHVACAILQNRMREELRKMKVVAFIADGSILPRRSGASSQPMQSPPAVPFKAPSESRLSATITVDGSRLSATLSVEKGSLTTFLPGEFSSMSTESTVVITGMIVPEGITLIVGGGYHGKSTMLRTIAAGVYNKVPGDGREFCVTVSDAVCVRAEDGRYVNNCNLLSLEVLGTGSTFPTISSSSINTLHQMQPRKPNPLVVNFPTVTCSMPEEEWSIDLNGTKEGPQSTGVPLRTR